MAFPNDALGIAAERVARNAKLTSIDSAISAYTGDANGLKDLGLKRAEVSDRLNLSSTALGNAYSGFGIGGVST